MDLKEESKKEEFQKDGMIQAGQRPAGLLNAEIQRKSKPEEATGFEI